MANLLNKLPTINLWKWANGNEYTIDDDTTTLTPELAKSDKETDEAYDKRFGQQKNKGNAGKSKGKQSSFKEKNKVSKDQLNKKQQSAKEPKGTNTEKEIVD